MTTADIIAATIDAYNAIGKHYGMNMLVTHKTRTYVIIDNIEDIIDGIERYDDIQGIELIYYATRPVCDGGIIVTSPTRVVVC